MTVTRARRRPKPDLEAFRAFYEQAGLPYFGFHLALAARFFDKKVTELLRRQNIVTLRQWRVISQLWLTEGLTVRRLAEHAAVDRAEVSRAVGQLEQLGYVERRANVEDQRSPLLYLTDLGREVTNTVREPIRELLEELLQGIAEEDIVAAHKTLQKFTLAAFTR